jgi:DNA polymerase III subunit beta
MIEADVAVGTGLKITCTREDLVARLGVVTRAVSTRGAVQVLAGVLLRVESGLLELGATDMELSLRTTLPADVEGDGALVVPGKLLADLARPSAGSLRARF